MNAAPARRVDLQRVPSGTGSSAPEAGRKDGHRHQAFERLPEVSV